MLQTIGVDSKINFMRSEGYNCELMNISNIQSKNMKYFQAQADLIIDQLIYGHWGSTSLECIALGKPVICYFNKEWKNNYINNFSIESWPVIEANTISIYSVIKGLYNFYFNKVTPFIGRIFSKDIRAYTYLPESVKAFPDNEKFVSILNTLHFKNTSFKSLSFGIAAIYEGEK
jgi:hypothetical protein